MNLLLSLVLFAASTTTIAGKLFLNGTDITGIKNQDVQQVDIHIDEHGDIYISAPHYSVTEQASYLPLGQYQSHPEHQATPTPVKGKTSHQPPPFSQSDEDDDKPATSDFSEVDEESEDDEENDDEDTVKDEQPNPKPTTVGNAAKANTRQKPGKG